jgi:hypothetical protein
MRRVACLALFAFALLPIAPTTPADDDAAAHRFAVHAARLIDGRGAVRGPVWVVVSARVVRDELGR